MVQLRCGLGWVGGAPLGGELGWGEIAWAVWPFRTVFDAPVLDYDAGFAEAAERPAVEGLVTELAFEGLDPGTLEPRPSHITLTHQWCHQTGGRQIAE